MKKVQHPRGSTAWNMAFTGAQSQLTYDTDLNQYRLHDGVTPGGWLIPKVADISVIGTQRFTAKATKSVPATPFVADDSGKLLEITVSGTYTLMAAATQPLGIPFFLKAKASGVTVQRAGSDQIEDKAGTVTSLSLTLNEIVEVVRQDTDLFLVMSRY